MSATFCHRGGQLPAFGEGGGSRGVLAEVKLGVWQWLSLKILQLPPALRSPDVLCLKRSMI